MTQQDPRTAPSAFSRGAVDLAGLGRATSQPESPAAPQASGAGVAVIDVTEATFQTEVLERSLTTPVVVDFWADWCAPCKQLSPILERLAIEGGGSWVLAKVDVEANPRLQQMFRIQSIPTVFAIVAGQPIDAFQGAVPESHVRQWLDAVLSAGGVEAPQAPVDPRIEEADDLLAAGDLAGAEEMYRQVLADSPAEPLAASGLAQVALMTRVQGVDARAAIAAAAERPDDLTAQTLAADVEAMSGRVEQAYARLLHFVRRSAGADREAARKHLVELFTIAEPDDPTVTRARRELAKALF